jgi:predicted SAM-dependent methyltransferase
VAKRKPAKGLKLDLACGQHPTEGFVGVDIWDGAEIVHDLLLFPWPFDDGSVTEVVCNHFVEHIPMREIGGADLLCAFMNELSRVTAPGAKVRIVHPHAHSDRAWWDPTHRRCIPYQTWYYFDPNWLRGNGLDHYPITANFEVITIEGAGVAADVLAKHHEVQAQVADRQWNIIADTVVILQRRP